MSKAILVMDMPENCGDCNYCCDLDPWSGVFCVVNGQTTDIDCKTPDWCPLQGINPNMLKALRCVASQDAMKDCYRTRYNRDRKEDEPLMTCKTLPDDLSIPCPYQQDEYKTNCEDGECMGWLNEIADMLEGK